MSQNDTNGLDRVRKVAEINLSIVLESKKQLTDMHGAAFRWILATLVTINGGGAIGIVGTDKISYYGKISGGSCFCTGVFFALMLAYANMIAIQKLLKPTMSILDFWAIALVSGHYDENDISNRQGSLQMQTAPWTIASHVLGWVSVVFFLAGVVQIGINLNLPPTPTSPPKTQPPPCSQTRLPPQPS